MLEGTLTTTMDELARYNRQRWEELVEADILYSRPMLELDEGSARAWLDPEGKMGEVAGKEVLCLAGGGGQQSVAFGLLGARVTVLDFSPKQLARDRRAAGHYEVKIKTVCGDMRDLSCLGKGCFDIVWHAHSLGFVPDAREVFAQVAGVLRVGGRYRLDCHNPFFHGLAKEDWDGKGYPLSKPYADGEVVYDDPHWDVDDGAGRVRRIKGPREFRHTLGTLVNSLISEGFVILGIWEETTGDRRAEPGSLEHFKAICPPGLTIWSHYQPGGVTA